MIGTDCIGSYKSNYNTITTTTAFHFIMKLINSYYVCSWTFYFFGVFSSSGFNFQATDSQWRIQRGRGGRSPPLKKPKKNQMIEYSNNRKQSDIIILQTLILSTSIHSTNTSIQITRYPIFNRETCENWLIQHAGYSEIRCKLVILNVFISQF